jgi:hypothetical protein
MSNYQCVLCKELFNKELMHESVRGLTCMNCLAKSFCKSLERYISILKYELDEDIKNIGSYPQSSYLKDFHETINRIEDEIDCFRNIKKGE